MFKISSLVSVSILIIAGSSCNNEDSFDCFKSTGEITELELSTEPFNRIEINDGMEIFLKNATEERVLLKGGKNLLSKVKVEFDSGLLRLSNENKCNWTRKYDPIQIYISAPEFNLITNYGYGKIVSLDTLKTDFLRIVIKFSSGDLNLTVDTKTLYYESNSMSSTILSGKVDRLYIGHFYNDGIFNSENLQATIANVLHKGYGRIRVRTDSLSGSIERNGLLEYYSKKETSGIEILGHGRLIYLGL